MRRFLPGLGLSLIFSPFSGGVRAAGGAMPNPLGPPPKPAPEAKDVETRIFLIGDAGVPDPKDPVLLALQREVSADPAKSVIVFLGDNVYPRGLPHKDSPDRSLAELKLKSQVDVVRATGATAIFVPGNHDWDKQGPLGWDAIKRQGEYIRETAAPGIALLPEGGCPGPVVRDFNTRVRLVILDTQWWLHAGPKPKHPDSSCPTDAESEVLDALTAALEGAGERRTVVVAHHPLATGGPHGGYFSWKDHIFPLRNRKPWLWIPLPGIGSVYPAARRRGASAQDMSGLANRRMREALMGVFEKHPPLVYAAGHEHNLQVIKGKNAKYLLVSGAGAFGHVTQTAWTDATLYASAVSGFMRLDVEQGGRVRLAVLTVGADGRATESLSLDLV